MPPTEPARRTPIASPLTVRWGTDSASTAQTIESRLAMGRAKMQSNPTEINGSWSPTGDDAYNATTDQGGWVFTQQTYDWKGRPLLTTNPSITSNRNDTTTKEAGYSGCGCAG